MQDGASSASLDSIILQGDLIVEFKVPMRGANFSLWQAVAAIDLGGLAPDAKAHALARNMTLAAFARAAMVDALKQAKADPFHLSQAAARTTASRSSYCTTHERTSRISARCVRPPPRPRLWFARNRQGVG